MIQTTWDGLPVAEDQPHGAMVVVRRPGHGGDPEYLMLHRAHRGPGYEGDWAWTPPSGARLPGEPVLTGAARELTEEAALTAPLIPVDLSGGWAVFAADVPAGTQVRIDPEHDRYTWLARPDAERRCRPETVLAGFRRGAAVPAPEISFRPPARIDSTSPTMVHVLLIDGLACGFIQHYHLRDYPSRQAACGGIDAIGIDFAIGAAELTGRGIGPQMIWRYLRQVVFPRWPGVPFVTASPEVANHRSIRALAKAGFVPSREIAGQPPGGPQLLCTLDRQRIFGPPTTAGDH
jgi:8-oxo-dGTP pyrophosphatase MutT (NUDIX family)